MKETLKLRNTVRCSTVLVLAIRVFFRIHWVKYSLHPTSLSTLYLDNSWVIGHSILWFYLSHGLWTVQVSLKWRILLPPCSCWFSLEWLVSLNPCPHFCSYIYNFELFYSSQNLSFSFITEKVKNHLAHAGLCELLVQLLEKHKPLVDDDETRNLMKMACDLIVLILTGGK